MNTETLTGQITMIVTEILIIGAAMVVADKLTGRVFRRAK